MNRNHILSFLPFSWGRFPYKRRINESEVKFCEQIKILSLYNRELKLLPWNQKVVFPSETHFKNKFLPEMCHSFQSSMVEIDHTKTQSQLVC